jgi:O-antigen/teichoic acid export membrane protein
MGLAQGIWDYVSRRAPKGRLLRGVTVLAGGSLAAQVIAAAVAPVSTRLYTPADYGMAAVYGSILSMAAIVASGRYELAIPLPADDETGLDLLALCLALLVGCTALLAVVIYLVGDRALALVHAPQLRPYMWLLPVSVLGAGAYQATNYWAVRRRIYGRIACTRVSQSVGGAVTTIGVGVVHHGPLGLLLGGIASQTAGVSILAKDAIATAGGVRLVPAVRLLNLARTYRQFPLFSTGAAILNNVGLTLPPLLLSAFYTPSSAGFFGLAQRMVLLPMSLVGSSVSQVFLGEAAQILKDKPAELPHLFGRVTRKLALLSVAIVALGAVSPVVFPVAFGARWREAGTYAALIAVYCALQIIVSPISTAAILLKRQDLQMALDAGRAVLVFVSLWLPHRLHLSPTTAVACYSAVMASTYCVAWAVYARIVRSVHGRDAVALEEPVLGSPIHG